MKRVFLITPYAGLDGDIQSNVTYLKRCMIDCLGRGEAPFASHGLYPQALRDDDARERALGLEAGRAWLAASDAAIAYVDRGVSSGMRGDLQAALAIKLPPVYGMDATPLPIEFRHLGAAPPADSWLHAQEVPHRPCPLCRILQIQPSNV